MGIRCSIAAANNDKLQFKFKFYSYVMWNCVDDKKDNEEGRAPLEYLPRGPRFSSYATAKMPTSLLPYRLASRTLVSTTLQICAAKF